MKPFTDLTRLTTPRSIVIVGASERQNSQGRRLTENLMLHSAFTGDIYLVNPGASEILGQPCYPSVAAIPASGLDVALVMVNASLVLPTLEQCAAKDIAYAIVMTSGFAETGDEGAALERQITALCARTGLRVYGPNCPGLVNVNRRLGMTFSPAFKDDLNAGTIGLATQGGGLGRNVLQALAHGNGVGVWYSGGNECDLGLPDFIGHMATDPEVRVIAVLMEGIKDGARLRQALALARENGKPVVILKVGRSEQGVLAAQSHTASIAGSAQINSAVFRQQGCVEVEDLDQLASVAHLLAASRPAADAGLAIFTFSGGTAAMAADIAGAAGLPLAQFSPLTTEALRKLLPSFANIANPLDTTADILRDPDVLTRCLGVVCDDDRVGAVMFPIPMDYGEITATMAQAVCSAARTHNKPVVPVWMSRRMGSGFELMEQAGLMPFFSLTDAVSALRHLFKGETALPVVRSHTHEEPSRSGPVAISESEAKALLREAGIVVPQGALARSEEEAVGIATSIGLPVVMKVASAQIAHKTEAGGVRLNLDSEASVSTAYRDICLSVAAARPDAEIDGVLVEKMFPADGREILVGVHRDAAFGLVLTVGLGGIFVEVLRDLAHRSIPITPRDASAMLRELRGYALLEGVRGQPPADIAALESLLMTVSEFARQQGERLHELDLNPVWVGPVGQGAIPLDALLVLDSTTSIS
ncbi:acetate--CoA ligase family protein [Variovorax rhizosphaerae]|uniref:Acetate--CoA ligase family protein n=1 Tax=Variovorax rhizosphaerae TaxID=1836200 RepID=A0ABU8WTW0_9BURK